MDTVLVTQNNIREFKIGKKYSYNEYLKLTSDLVAGQTTSGPVKSSGRIAATKLNLQRMIRVSKTTRLLPEWDSVENAGEKLQWLLISEPWCGDGAQIVPVISQIAEKLGITLDIILRDEHTEVIDKYPFRNTRSIPWLISFDKKSGIELGNWGPRPMEAIQLVDDAKAAGIPHDEYMISLQNWYNQNKTVSLQNELFSFVTDCLR